MWIRLIVVGLVAFLPCASMAFAEDPVGAAPRPLTAERMKAIETQVRPWVEAEAIVGISIGVIDGDRQGVFGFGALALGSDRAPDADTIYEIGSVSKVFTGVLLAHAVEDGIAKLDDPVEKHVPERVTIPSLDGELITLKRLSTHSSGLPRMPDNFDPADPNDPFADYSEDRLHAFLMGHTLARLPGARSEYSNVGAGLLGHVLGAKAGGYEALVKSKIAVPLGMSDTVLLLSDAQKKRFAEPHGGDGSPSHTWAFDALAGAGAIRSTVTDMLCFVRAHLDPPDSALGRAMSVATTLQRSAADAESAMGLGWVIRPEGHRWHNGQTGGYKSFVGMDLDNHRAVIVLSNTSTSVVDQIGNNLLRHLAGKNVPAPTVERPVKVDPKILDRYVGTYALTPAFKLEVTRDGPRLYVQATNQPRLRVFPRSETEFVYRVVDARIVFEADGDGPSPNLVLHQNGVEMRAGARVAVYRVARSDGASDASPSRS